MAGPFACIRSSLTAWSAFPPERRAEAICRLPGRQTAPSSPSRRRAPGDPEIWLADASGGNLHKHHLLQRARRCAHLEPAHQCADRVGQRTHRRAADLHHGPGWLQRAAHHRRRLCRLASWSPNGQLLTFSWNRKYGPGDPGGVDIHVIDIASKNWIQVTHESGSNDFPSWAPDRRHIVFERTIGRQHRDLDHAGRRNRAASANPLGQQLHAQLELEVMKLQQCDFDERYVTAQFANMVDWNKLQPLSGRRESVPKRRRMVSF